MKARKIPTIISYGKQLIPVFQSWHVGVLEGQRAWLDTCYKYVSQCVGPHVSKLIISVTALKRYYTEEVRDWTQLGGLNGLPIPTWFTSWIFFGDVWHFFATWFLFTIIGQSPIWIFVKRNTSIGDTLWLFVVSC